MTRNLIREPENSTVAELRRLISENNITQLEACNLPPRSKRMSFKSFQKYLIGERYPAARQIKELEEYVRMLRVRLAGRQLKAVSLKIKKGVYQTRLVSAIENWLEYAVKHHDVHIVLLVGTWGHGKTYATQNIIANGFRHTAFYWEARPGAAVNTLLNRILAFLDLDAGYTVDDKLAVIIERLSSDPVVLIVDQAEELSNSALNMLAYLWDQTHAPIVLLAAPSIEGHLTAGRGAKKIARLRSRLWRGTLPAPSPEEISAIVRHICGSRPWAPGVFQYFYDRTGAGNIRRAVTGATAIEQVVKATRGTSSKTPITKKLLDVALRPLL